jgi:hypothetical protein
MATQARAPLRDRLVAVWPQRLVASSIETRLFAACFAVAAALLFADATRQFEDESDDLLGAILIVRGARLYADYFSSHMPFVYYLSAVPALFGAWHLEDFRLYSDVLLLGATLWIAWAFRARLGIPADPGIGRGTRLPGAVAWTWAVITVFAHRIQWGEMLHAGTVAGFGVLATGLFFYTSRDLRFGWLDKLGLSFAVFVAVQSSLLTLFPLGLLALCYVAVRVRRARHGSPRAELRGAATLLALVALPNLVLVAWTWAIGALPPFVYDAYVFNQRYYSRFLMNSSTIGLLHDWEAQYRTYLAMNLARPGGIDFYLIVAVFGATAITWARRGPLVAALFYLFVALCRVRAEGSYYLSAYFSAALCLVWAASVLADAVARWRGLLVPARGRAGAPGVLALGAAGLFVLLSLGFAADVLRLYDFGRQPAYRSPFVRVVAATTQPGERIFVAPYDPYLFIASERLPATRYGFYFPWQAADPATEADIIDELRAARPPVVIFMRDELVNGQYLTRSWGAGLLDVLEREYVQLDPTEPVLADVFVRPDRLAAARAQLGLPSPPGRGSG